MLKFQAAGSQDSSEDSLSWRSIGSMTFRSCAYAWICLLQKRRHCNATRCFATTLSYFIFPAVDQSFRLNVHSEYQNFALFFIGSEMTLPLFMKFIHLVKSKRLLFIYFKIENIINLFKIEKYD